MTPTRPVDPDDLPLLVRLERACFADSAWTTTQLEGALATPAAITLLAPPDLGYVIARQVVDLVELDRIGVAPHHRQHGHGATLLQALIEQARLRHAQQVLLEVSADNSAAVALYERFAFTEVGRRRGYYRGGSDAVVMSRPL